MANYTPNYRLHQWEPEDKFLRTDFNEDFSTIDAALGKTERSARASAYNVYNLMLQSDYEGKYTGYKKALLFDGFTDGAGIAELADTLVLRERSLCLSGTAQEDVEFPYFSDNQKPGGKTAEMTATGNGFLTAVTFYDKRYSSAPEEHTVSYTLYRNGEEVERGSLTVVTNGLPDTQQLTLSRPAEVRKGDRVHLYLSAPGNYYFYCVGSKTDDLAATYHFRGAAGEQGTARTVSFELPEHSGLMAWVRHSGGSVTLSLEQAEARFPLEGTGVRDTMTLDGQPCQESAFHLERSGSGPASFVLELTREAEEARIYDYGIAIW